MTKHCTAISIVVFYFGMAAFHAGAEDLESSDTDWVERFLNANNLQERGDAWDKIFHNIPFHEVPDAKRVVPLVYHENADIALCAAWHRMLLLTKESIDRNDSEKQVRAVAQRESLRFLGFVEGRLKIPVPEEWAASLRSMKVVDDKVVGTWWYSWDFVEFGKPFDYIDGNDELTYPTDIAYTLKDHKLVIRNDETYLQIGDQKCLVPKKFLDKIKDRSFIDKPSGIPGLIHEGHCIQLFPIIMGSYPIICVDIDTGKVVWESEVWHARQVGVSGLPRLNSAIPVIHGSVVYIFGSSAVTEFYIEGFCLKTGKATVRFSSVY